MVLFQMLVIKIKADNERDSTMVFRSNYATFAAGLFRPFPPRRLHDVPQHAHADQDQEGGAAAGAAQPNSQVRSHEESELRIYRVSHVCIDWVGLS